MKKKIASEFLKQFDKLKLKKCKNLYVTSNLSQFSHVRLKKQEKLKIILDCDIDEISDFIKNSGKNKDYPDITQK